MFDVAPVSGVVVVEVCGDDIADVVVVFTGGVVGPDEYISNGCTIWPKLLRNGSIWFFSFLRHLALLFLNHTF